MVLKCQWYTNLHCSPQSSSSPVDVREQNFLKYKQLCELKTRNLTLQLIELAEAAIKCGMTQESKSAQTLSFCRSLGQ